MTTTQSVAIVTGGSQGVGRATALRLARDFSAIVLAARDKDKLEQTAADVRSAGAEAMTSDLDLRQPQSAETVIKGALDRFARIDALLRIAGAVPQVDLFEMTDAQWDDAMALKFHGARRLTMRAWDAGHGSEQRALFVYQVESYQYWERILGRSDFAFGQFGENLTVEGLADNQVWIGDAIFEVTQPRVTCYRLGIRMNEPRMPALLVAHGRPGFYFRVLQEGEVGAGDEIEKVADGPEQMTVTDIDPLLYLPGHSRSQLERALRIPALSPGWQNSFGAILKQESGALTSSGNPGIANEEPAPAWLGFRQMRVASIRKESASVMSFVLVWGDGQPLPAAQPGQFVVFRLQVDPDRPPVIRSYSLSDLPSADHVRVSVKSEPIGTGSSFLCNKVREGQVLDVSAPRGSFTLKSGNNPVVLLSAGVGATPVISMLHHLAAEKSNRQIGWTYGARNRSRQRFAEESRSLVTQLPRARSHIVYSRPNPTAEAGVNFDIQGHMEVALLEKLNIPRDAAFYLCGPSPFLESMREGIRNWGVPAECVHMETFGVLGSITPGLHKTGTAGVGPAPHQPSGPPGAGPSVSFSRSGINVAWNSQFASLLELAEACEVAVGWSCRIGVCHMCMTGLIGGSTTYQPEPLERPTPGNVLLCCSQPEANVTLDL